jgi:hypothetical protein
MLREVYYGSLFDHTRGAYVVINDDADWQQQQPEIMIEQGEINRKIKHSRTEITDCDLCDCDSDH